jgi:putative ABC transport system substrate-binding protein
MGVSGDPVGAGYVASLARPGGNVTGLAYLSPDVNPKLIEALNEAMPTLTRLAVIWNVDNHVKKLDFEEASAAARRLGVLGESMPVRRSSDLDTAFAAIAPRSPPGDPDPSGRGDEPGRDPPGRHQAGGASSSPGGGGRPTTRR